MRAIAALLFMVFGAISMIVANVLHWEAEAELLAKTPEPEKAIYCEWPFLRRHRLVNRYYSAEFPTGNRIRQSWRWGIIGIFSLFSGYVVLAFFQ
jgi:hypothetical protein